MHNGRFNIVHSTASVNVDLSVGLRVQCPYEKDPKDKYTRSNHLKDLTSLGDQTIITLSPGFTETPEIISEFLLQILLKRV